MPSYLPMLRAKDRAIHIPESGDAKFVLYLLLLAMRYFRRIKNLLTAKGFRTFRNGQKCSVIAGAFYDVTFFTLPSFPIFANSEK